MEKQKKKQVNRRKKKSFFFLLLLLLLFLAQAYNQLQRRRKFCRMFLDGVNKHE